MPQQPLAPPWCLLLGGRLRHGIDDEDYAKKRSLLPLDINLKSTQSWGFPSFDAESSIGCMKLQALVTNPPDFSSLVLKTEKGLFPAIHAVDKNLIVFFSHLPNEIDGIYVIYDTISKALSVLPSEPPRFEFDMTLASRPLIVRRYAKDDPYALVLMGKKPTQAGGQGRRPRHLAKRPRYLAAFVLVLVFALVLVLALALATANLPGDWLESGGATTFLADVTFSFQGHAFWADLLCGVLFCRSSDLFSHSVTCVNVGFIDLPTCCQAEADVRFTGTLAGPEAYRTMGCSRGSIKFVSIDFQLFHGNRRVTVWRLHFSSKTWVKQYMVTQKHLWKQPEFTGANPNLPRDMTLMHPIINTVEEDVICLMLGKYKLGSTGIIIPYKVSYSIRVNMFNGTILSYAPIPSPYTLAPVILSSDFTCYIPSDSDTPPLGPPVASPSGNERGQGRGRGQVTLPPLAGQGRGWGRAPAPWNVYEL
uniref:DUF1618 domain-containing protein n=1 Tax=Oryza barthii TaxID=65489 RepID=A0A0D3FQ01_9ORYZ